MADPRGRQPIGVNQPPSGGTNYPFIRPSTDIQYLLGDFYLSYEDNACDHPYPLKVAWLYGFGTNAVAPPGGFNSPTHAQDIVIKDNNGATVFDSTLSSVVFTSYTWNDRLTIFEWIDSDREIVCRCTQHTEWTQADIDDGNTVTYDDYITPTDGRLDPRTYNKLPLRVKKITVGLTDLTGNIALEEGYNMSLVSTPYSAPVRNVLSTPSMQKIEGFRRTNLISLNASPAAGIGVFPACEGDNLNALRRLNGAGGDPHGNLNLDSEGCIRYQRPVGLTSSTPREFRYASSVLSNTQAASALEFLNDCGPCCDCEYFARTYQGLKRQWFFYQAIATDAETTRDTLDKNLDRWNAQKICRESRPLNVSLQIEPECKVVHSVIFGNPSKCCLRNTHFRFTFRYYREGVEISPPELKYFDCLRTEVLGSPQKEGPEIIQLVGKYPVYEALIDYIEPQDNGRITFRFCFPNCSETDRVSIRTDVYWENVTCLEQYPEYPLLNSICTYPNLEIDATTQALWEASELGMPTYDVRYNEETKALPLNNTDLYCAQCECDAGGSAESQSTP